ncbi:MAG: hypothetical protein H6732_09885 [Alphaproteobacteria bacterium]|nr:hypothetical protein [Alphaproteobacteria bacterium]
MLADPKMSVAEIAAWLDGMGHPQRLEAMSTTTKAEQKRLWELAAASAPITAEHFVPASVGTRREVIHHGRNTLPALNSFQKRFARPEDGSNRFFGYNHASTRWLIGPGYFVAHDTEGNAAWQERGAWVVDYFQVPDGPVPDGWPGVRANHVGLQVLVYFHTRDFMRKVSEHVSIGMAFKNESSLNNWFTLVREDVT